MSFFFDTIEIPFWFIVFIFASVAPLWIKWYKKFHNKFIVTGLLNKTFRRARSTAELKIDVLKKATDHWNDNSELTRNYEGKVKKRKPEKKTMDLNKKQNIQVVLKALADAGETGVLPKSISDKMSIDSLETSNALTYLVEKEYAEIINASSGSKYYLTDLGRQYCLNKKLV